MLGKVKSLDARLLSRRCVRCGYDGALLRGGQARRCAKCGCDLKRRPARSYAEMEGLLSPPLSFNAPLIWPRNEVRLAHRWVAFLFLWAVLLGAITCLSIAALGG